MQQEFDFSKAVHAPAPIDPVDTWREARKRELLELSKALGLPLGKRVEIWLKGGVRLRGTLRLREETLLHAETTAQDAVFEIDNVPFRTGDFESCVAL
jgi:hypothetical protein